MRFYLDHDVDARVGKWLRQLGHVCWTAAEAKNAHLSDDDQTVYAFSKQAILVTHDVEFSKRRIETTYGKHIFLRCQEPDAIGVLDKWLDDVIPILQRPQDVTITMTLAEFKVHR